jgi:hypothetical protein
LPNRILPSLRRVFPFAAFGHWIVLKNKLKNSFFSVHFLGTSSLPAQLSFAVKMGWPDAFATQALARYSSQEPSK